MSKFRIRLGASTLLLTGAFVLVHAHCNRLRAEDPPGVGHEETTKNCEQIDKAWLAIRACTALLNALENGNSARIQYYRSRGLAWLKEEEPKEALLDFSRALEIDETDLRSLTGLARANSATGAHNAAAVAWTRALDQAARLQSEPADTAGEMYLDRGTAWLADGNTDAALADFAKALELKPKNAAAHIALASTYIKLNDRDRALDEFDRASKIDPSDIRPYMARAEAAERWGDTKLAIESYLLAATSNPRGAGHARQALKRLGVDRLP